MANASTLLRDVANLSDDASAHTSGEMGHLASAAYHGIKGLGSLAWNGPNSSGFQELSQAAFEGMQANLTGQDIYDGAKLINDLIS